MDVSAVLLAILILLLCGALPVYPYSRGWGYSPFGVLLVIVFLLLLAMNHIIIKL